MIFLTKANRFAFLLVEKMLYVFLLTYFSLLFSPWCLLAFLICTAAIKFSCFCSNEIGLRFFLFLALALSLFSTLM